MKNSNNSSGQVIGAIIAGAAIGGILALIFAPAKGSKTRGQIAEKSGELTDAMKEKFDSFMEEVKSEGRVIKEKANNFLQTEKELNEKIMKITMEINEKYPELTKYIEEMSATIPYVENPEISLQYLRKYYESLNTMLKTYREDHPNKTFTS